MIDGASRGGAAPHLPGLMIALGGGGDVSYLLVHVDRWVKLSKWGMIINDLGPLRSK